MRMISLNR